jgi:putative NIF3 family GTP cyclohydrolase 1 type 2
MHTNLDNVSNGVNDKICKKLNLSETKILAPRITKNGFEIGAGMTGFLPEPLSEEGFLNYLCGKMETDFVRFTRFSKSISKIAVCGGSGSFLLNDAILAGADAFVTSDFKYHQFFDTEEKLMIADIGHYESEKFTQELLEEFIRQEFKSLLVRQTSVNTNPVSYFRPKTD